MTDPRFSFVSSLGAETQDEQAIRSLLEETLIRVVVTDEAVTTFAGQVATYQVATLLIRLFDHVELVGDETASRAGAIPLAGSRFLTALRSLLPTLRPLPKAHEVLDDAQITVVVGSDPTSTVHGHLYIGCTAWGAYLSTISSQPIADTRVPIGALAAGTLGASEIFKLVFRDNVVGAYTTPHYSISLLDYQSVGNREPELPERIEIDVTLFGSGSVGCAFLLGLIFVPQLHGQLTVVDNGCFDTRNPFKYVLLDWASAQQQWFKAVWAQQRVREYTGDRLLIRAFVGTAQEYVASLPHDYTIPLAISAVDTPDARIEIQDTLPRHIINAGVDGTEVDISAHGFGDGPCLACLQLDAKLASWDGKVIAEATGLPPERVYELMIGNLGMNQMDADILKSRPHLTAEQCAEIDTFVGQPLLSYWHRVAYSEALVHTESGSAPAHVTTAFVSAFAGILLLAELLKACVSELGACRVNNSYRQQLLGVPTCNVFQYHRDERGWCLCHSPFRQLVYREKYGGVNADSRMALVQMRCQSGGMRW